MAENGTGAAMTAREAFEVPDRVYAQLTKGFVPAVKHVSTTGNALLKSYDRKTFLK